MTWYTIVLKERNLLVDNRSARDKWGDEETAGARLEVLDRIAKSIWCKSLFMQY